MLDNTTTRTGLAALQRERLQRAGDERALRRRRRTAERGATVWATLGLATILTGAAAVAVMARLLNLLVAGHGLL
jgi:hypothetical protein